MAKFIFLLICIGLVNSQLNWKGSPSIPKDADQCFCRLNGKVEDCLCDIGSVDRFNNIKVFPRLSSLLYKDYFRYFRYNAKKPCPFWSSEIGKCSSKGCGVNPCTKTDLPPGLVESHEKDKYSNPDHSCQESDDGNNVDDTLSEKVKLDLRAWENHDESATDFCDVDEEICPDCQYVDLTLNPERYTGYSNEDSRRIWRAIYEENCFKPDKETLTQTSFSGAFIEASLKENFCFEKRAFYRAISGLHTSITIHLSSIYPLDSSTTIFKPQANTWGPNLQLFIDRFDPKLTNDQGPYWLKNLYFVYLLEMRALVKASKYFENNNYYTGRAQEDQETQKAVKEIMSLLKSFPGETFSEASMFKNEVESSNLKEEFRTHFLNITKIMDCVGCDKCRLWGKLQTSGLGTALKILFSEPENRSFSLTRNEIVSIFNAFGRISTSIRQIEKFREMMRN